MVVVTAQAWCRNTSTQPEVSPWDDDLVSNATHLGDADIARAAGLFADPTRAQILIALADGRSLPAGVLAAEAGVTAQAASAQLARLREAGLIEVEASGRSRYYRLSSAQVAVVLEALAGLAPAQPVRSLRQGSRAQALRESRTCYDHLAGRLGVAVTQALVDRGALVAVDEGLDPPYRLGESAPDTFAALGVPPERLLASGTSRRPLLRFCVDWTEQRHHLAGRLGSELLTAVTSAGWIVRKPRQRAVRLTELGAEELRARLGLGSGEKLSTASESYPQQVRGL